MAFDGLSMASGSSGKMTNGDGFPLLRPSFSNGGAPVSPSSKFTSKLKKFQGKASIIDEPQLVELCEYYISTKNITGLSLIARQRGLPPHLRRSVWPLLLKSHPFLIKPYITPDEDEDLETVDIKAKIKYDLKRYFRKSHHNHIDVNDMKLDKKEPPSLDSQKLKKVEEEIIKVMEYSILKFMKKWGSLINYNSGLTWIALGLAEWVPPLTSSEEISNYVLCGREFVNKNGETALKDLNDEANKYFEYSSDIFNSNNSPMYSRRNTDTNSDDSSNISVSTYTTNNSNSQFSQTQIRQNTNSSKSLTFAEVYERMVLVILHSPEPSEDSHSSTESDDGEESLEEKILTTLPAKGGTAEERISFFLYCLRRLLPELAQFFIDEDILNTTSVKDDWVIWWLKWCGAKVWSKYDRGRIWDMLLGWRVFDMKNVNKQELNDLLLDDGLMNLLGPDIFWHPLTLDNEELEDKPIKSLISSFSATNLLSLGREEEDLCNKIPFASLDPHTEIVFISLSFIKSKEFALLELEQSEIRDFLNKASSTKLGGFQNLFEDEMNSNDNNNNMNNDNENNEDKNNDTTPSPRDEQRKVPKNRLRDIENIIIESGELWRKWIWQEIND